MSVLLEAIAYVIAGVGIFAFLLVCAMGVLWIGDLFSTRELYPSTHVAGEDDQDVDFDAALRSIGGPR